MSHSKDLQRREQEHLQRREEQEQDKKLVRQERFGTGAPMKSATTTGQRRKIAPAPWDRYVQEAAAEKKLQSAELHEKNKEAWGVSGKNARDLSPLGPQDLDEEGASCFT